MEQPSENMYPSSFVPTEEKKTKDYILEYAKTLWSDAINQKTTINFNERADRYINNRKYSEGLQSIEKFKTQFSSTGDATYLNLDWDVSTPLPKLAEVIRNQMINQPFKPQFAPVDSISKTDYDRERLVMIAKMEMKKALAGLEEKKIINIGKNIPEDDDELEIYMATNFKLAQSMAMESITQAILEDNDFERTQKKIAKDLTDIKICASRITLDEDKNIQVNYIDPVKLVTSFVRRDDFKDARHIGVLEDITIEDLRVQAAGELSEEDLYIIAKSCAGKYDNGLFPYQQQVYYNSNVTNPTRYNKFNVRVLDFEFFSTDPLVVTKVDSSNGGKKVLINEESKNKKATKKVSVKKVKNVYVGKYIVDTDYLYDFGLKKHIIRERLNGRYSTNTTLGFVVSAPDIYDMENKSKVEEMISYADELIRIQLKMQQVIAKAKPSGYMINVDTVVEALQGMGMGGMTPLDARAITDQIGDVYFKEFDENGRPLTAHQSPVTPLPNGLDNTILILTEAYNACLARMKETIGLNSAIDAGQPDKRAAVGVQKLAAAAHKQANKSLYDAYLKFNEDVVRQVALLSQQLIRKGINIDKFENMVGKETVKQLDMSKLSAADFAINVKMLPDEEEQMQLNQLVELQLTAQPPRINLSDAFAIRTVMKEDIQKAEQLLVVRERRRAKEQQQASAALQQQNAQVQMQSNQAAEQSRQQTIQMEAELKAKVLQAEYDLKLRNDMQLEEAKRITMSLEADFDMQRLQKAAELKAQTNGGNYDVSKDSVPQIAGKIEPNILPENPLK